MDGSEKRATRLGRVVAGAICLAITVESTIVAADESDVGDEGTTLGFERVDLIDDGSGNWVNYELPMVVARTEWAAWQWARQLQLVMRTWVRGLTVGVSLDLISVGLDVRVTRAVGVFGALQTAMFLPRGLTLGWALRLGPIRVAVGASLMSTTRWADPHWTCWSVAPVVGIGIGREDASLASF